MTRPIRYPLLALGILLIGGCTVGPDYAGPPELRSTAASEGFARAGGANSREPRLAQWWTALGDPVLDELEQRALAGNPDLTIAQARIDEASAALGEVKANENPSVSAMGVAAHIRVPGLDLGQQDSGEAEGSGQDRSSANFYNLGLNGSWEVDLFGGHRRQLQAARADLEAAHAGMADAQVSLTAAVAQAYLNLRGRNENIALAEQAVAKRSEILALERERFDRGVIAQAPVDQADAAQATARQQLSALQGEAESFANALAILVGEAPGTTDSLIVGAMPPPLPPANIAIGDPATLIARRPDIRSAERALAGSSARIGVAKASGLPRLSFLGILGIGGTRLSDLTHLDDFTAIGAPMLQWNFLDFGRNTAQVGQAEARRAAAEGQYRKSVLNALREVEDALSAFRYRRQSVGSLARAQQSAERLTEQASQRYAAGTASRRELLDAQINQATAERDLASARLALTLDFVSLEKALGLGWQGNEPLASAEVR